jgi:hypothetical protein
VLLRCPLGLSRRAWGNAPDKLKHDKDIGSEYSIQTLLPVIFPPNLTIVKMETV